MNDAVPDRNVSSHDARKSRALSVTRVRLNGVALHVVYKQFIVSCLIIALHVVYKQFIVSCLIIARLIFNLF